MTLQSRFGVRVERSAPTKLYPFTRFFRGFDQVPAIRELFGPKTTEILRAEKVEFFSTRFGYMGTSDVDGHLLINTRHLHDSPFATVYLDVVHELRHVKQFRDGKPLFYPKLSYVDAPSEIEAYRFTVEEGHRIGLSEGALIDYLKTDWMTDAEHRRLARRCGLVGKPRAVAGHRGRLRR